MKKDARRVSNLAELEAFAVEVAKDLSVTDTNTNHNTGREQATVLALLGDLGSGKTAFVKMLAKALGVEENVSSPTFIIEKFYTLPTNSLSGAFTQLIHIDAYRLEKPEELERLGWAGILANRRNLICIEWPEKVARLIPLSAQTLSFTLIDETTREIARS